MGLVVLSTTKMANQATSILVPAPPEDSFVWQSARSLHQLLDLFSPYDRCLAYTPHAQNAPHCSRPINRGNRARVPGLLHQLRQARIPSEEETSFSRTFPIVLSVESPDGTRKRLVRSTTNGSRRSGMSIFEPLDLILPQTPPNPACLQEMFGGHIFGWHGPCLRASPVSLKIKMTVEVKTTVEARTIVEVTVIVATTATTTAKSAMHLETSLNGKTYTFLPPRFYPPSDPVCGICRFFRNHRD